MFGAKHLEVELFFPFVVAAIKNYAITPHPRRPHQLLRYETAPHKSSSQTNTYEYTKRRAERGEIVTNCSLQPQNRTAAAATPTFIIKSYQN
jgi:hypothetical protein